MQDKGASGGLIEVWVKTELGPVLAEAVDINQPQSMTKCEPTAHRFFPSDSASFCFRRFGPTAHRGVLCRPGPLLAILP